jgi:protein-S-isoprenylcysteine O-methyltransferase Ste14
MNNIARIVLMVFWVLWAWPYAFLAPHRQKRASVTVAGPTRVGLLLQALAFGFAFYCRIPAGQQLPAWRVAATIVFGAFAAASAWPAVRHLGRQFRLHAGLYEDHKLVTTGPYAIVRHPIYSSVFALLMATLFALTSWQWFPIALVLVVGGTEIRVRSEDALLASRFGPEFEDYRRRVPAWLPFVR